MKQIIILSILFTSIGSANCSQNEQSVIEQLININQQWASLGFNDSFYQERLPILQEQDIIQLHLALVEGYLRQTDVRHLSSNQRTKRKTLLDELRNYRETGVFPINLHHDERTPYFIDHFGTACAVGQLVIKSGGIELAQTISSNSNYEYIDTLTEQYPQILVWAQEYGFTQEELAWIQPTYEHCAGTCNRTVLATPNSGWPGYTYSWYPSGDSTAYLEGLCTGSTHTCTITDGLGQIVPDEDITLFIDGNGTNVYESGTVTFPVGVLVEVSINLVDEGGICEHKLVATGSSSSDDYPVQNYLWDHESIEEPTIEDVCPGAYTVIASTWGASGVSCTKSSTFTIEIPSDWCYGDFSDNGSRDTADLIQLLSKYGGESSFLGDMNADLMVDTSDLINLLALFGSDCP